MQYLLGTFEALNKLEVQIKIYFNPLTSSYARIIILTHENERVLVVG